MNHRHTRKPRLLRAVLCPRAPYPGPVRRLPLAATCSPPRPVTDSPAAAEAGSPLQRVEPPSWT
jgi:hypothetical protein